MCTDVSRTHSPYVLRRFHDGGVKNLRNVDKFLPDCTTEQPRGQPSLFSLIFVSISVTLLAVSLFRVLSACHPTVMLDSKVYFCNNFSFMSSHVLKLKRRALFIT
jgi:hypothetical protein